VSFLAAKPTADPALRLARFLLHSLVQFVNGLIEFLASLFPKVCRRRLCIRDLGFCIGHLWNVKNGYGEGGGFNIRPSRTSNQPAVPPLHPSSQLPGSCLESLSLTLLRLFGHRLHDEDQQTICEGGLEGLAFRQLLRDPRVTTGMVQVVANTSGCGQAEQGDAAVWHGGRAINLVMMEQEFRDVDRSIVLSAN
jgi:hypothetical protein